MPKPSDIMATSAAFLNDSIRDTFTNAALLPLFNQALRDLEKEYELNDIPVTYETSANLNIPAGTAGTVIKINKTNPGTKLPRDLVEIKEIWESAEGQDIWTPLGKRDFLPKNLIYSGAQIPQFLIWAWNGDEVNLIAASQNNDIKIDYVKSLFTPVTDVEVDLGVKFDKCYSYLAYRTAAFGAYFIGENQSRAEALVAEANSAMLKDLGISVKGTQSITTRRMPFRYGYKFRGYRGVG